MKKLSLLAVLSVLPLTAFANSVQLPWAKITETTVHATEFGQCLARINLNVSGPTGGECRGFTSGSFVTFSCSGVHLDKEIASRLFETAQIAQFADRNVRLTLDTTKTHNNYCLVTRIDVQ